MAAQRSIRTRCRCAGASTTQGSAGHRQESQIQWEMGHHARAVAPWSQGRGDLVGSRSKSRGVRPVGLGPVVGSDLRPTTGGAAIACTRSSSRRVVPASQVVLRAVLTRGVAPVASGRTGMRGPTERPECQKDTEYVPFLGVYWGYTPVYERRALRTPEARRIMQKPMTDPVRPRDATATVVRP